MRYICTGCTDVFGAGLNKLRNGYCDKCWAAYLSASKENGHVLMDAWEEKSRFTYVPQPITYNKKWFGVKFFLRTLLYMVNRKVCKLLNISVRKHIFPRIKVAILNRNE